MLESEQQRYSKFDEPIRACLQRYPQLTEHSFLFNSFLHINRVPPISWLAWQGKRMPLYGWTIGTFFLNATGLCSFSIQGNIVVRDSAFWPRPKNVIIFMYFFTIMNFVLILLGLKPVRRTRFFLSMPLFYWPPNRLISMPWVLLFCLAPRSYHDDNANLLYWSETTSWSSKFCCMTRITM